MAKVSSWCRWCPEGCGKKVEYSLMLAPRPEMLKHRRDHNRALVWLCYGCGRWFSKEQLAELNGKFSVYKRPGSSKVPRSPLFLAPGRGSKSCKDAQGVQG
jgi:hypothetical protein